MSLIRWLKIRYPKAARNQAQPRDGSLVISSLWKSKRMERRSIYDTGETILQKNKN